MATTRYSLGPSQAGYLTQTSVGAATVSTPIEVTVDWPALISSGISATQARMQVINVLGLIEGFIENGNKAALPG